MWTMRRRALQLLSLHTRKVHLYFPKEMLEAANHSSCCLGCAWQLLLLHARNAHLYVPRHMLQAPNHSTSCLGRAALAAAVTHTGCAALERGHHRQPAQPGGQCRVGHVLAVEGEQARPVPLLQLLCLQQSTVRERPCWDGLTAEVYTRHLAIGAVQGPAFHCAPGLESDAPCIHSKAWEMQAAAHLEEAVVQAQPQLVEHIVAKALASDLPT